MSSSPRRSTPDASYGDDPLSDDQGGMQDITISGDMNPGLDGGVSGSEPEQSGPTVLDKSALRRYSGWITLVVASSIAYASLVVERTYNNKAQGARTFCFAVLGTSLIVSIAVSGCFIAPDCNNCTKAFVSPSSSAARYLELFLTILMLILWCIGLPMIMNPANFIAVGSTQIVNGNLYIASWVCFGSIIFLVGDMLGDVFAGPQGAAIGLSRLDPETGEYVTTAPFTTVHYKRLWETRRGKWFALAAITGIALSATVLTFQSLCKAEMVQTYASNSTCIDSKVAIAMMVLGGIISLVMLGIGSIGGSLAEYLEKLGAVTTTIIWTIGLGVITFGDGPGQSLGNLFFATWAGFVTSVLITADCFRDSITRRAQAVASDDQIEMQGAPGVDDSDI